LINRKAKTSIVFLVLLIFAILILNSYKQKLSLTQLSGDTLWIIALSSLLNIGVVIYHYTIPPHPKFLLLPKRKWTIRLHVWSGTIELMAGILACFFYSPEAATMQASAALFIHVPTALLQTPLVFGSKAIMTPSYLLCIFIHAFCALMLLQNPTSHAWAINTFLIFNVYAWCRFYFYLLDRFKLFSADKYSISIIFAGLTIIPVLFGAISILLLISYIGLYIILVRFFFIRGNDQYQNFIHERGRDSLFSSDFIRKYVHISDIKKIRHESERDKADYVFKLIDFNSNSYLSEVELGALLKEWGLSKNEVNNYFKTLDCEKINFDIFFHKMKPFWKYIYFDILRGIDTNDSGEMIGRSLDGIKSGKKVNELKKEIEISLLKNTAFLMNAGPKLVEDLAASLLVRELQAGEILFHEGETGDRFYLIGKGELSIYKSNEYITTLSTGACVGEMALLENQPRNATVRSESYCQLYSLSRASFDYVLNSYPNIKLDIKKIIKIRNGGIA
jgi:hypothetical protein